MLPEQGENLKTYPRGKNGSTIKPTGADHGGLSGISKKRAYQSKTIAKHPDIVERVKAQARENVGKQQKGIPITQREGGTVHPGITDKRAHQSRAIAKHPEIVEKVKAQARENEAKVENLLFLLWVQDQRFDYWKKVLQETKKELENLKEEMKDNEGQFNNSESISEAVRSIQ